MRAKGGDSKEQKTRQAVVIVDGVKLYLKCK